MRFLRLRFNTQVFSESGKRFLASKMSNLNSPHVFTPKGVIFRKNFRKFFHMSASPLLCGSSKNFFLAKIWSKNRQNSLFISHSVIFFYSSCAQRLDVRLEFVTQVETASRPRLN